MERNKMQDGGREKTWGKLKEREKRKDVLILSLKF